VSLFQATLQEEKVTDQALSEIAETAVNAEARKLLGAGIPRDSNRRGTSSSDF
jgi:hypothetical protein